MKPLYHPFEIEERDLGPAAPWEPGTISFFELVYVESGAGVQHSGAAAWPFAAGQVLLLLPDTRYSLEFTAPGRVHFIRFQKIYFARTDIQGHAFNYGAWFRKLEFLFHSGEPDGRPLLAPDGADAQTVRWLVQVLLHEYRTARAYCDVVVQNSLFSVLTILARQRAFPVAGTAAVHPARPQRLLEYLHYHIHEPDKLTVAHLAEEFAVAPTYFGAFFKRTYGQPLKQYVLRYKLQLVKTRLQFTDLSLGQIADELQFTDVAHLRKTFRQQLGAELGECRQVLHEARRGAVAAPVAA